jgi:hypothetical protein
MKDMEGRGREAEGKTETHGEERELSTQTKKYTP